jgi:hypothetical protein
MPTTLGRSRANHIPELVHSDAATRPAYGDSPSTQLAPAKLVQFLKGRSSRMLQRDFQHLRKRYWGQHLWARGYFCATVGAVDEKTVMAYIESQKWDQDDEGFKVVAPTEP